MSRLYGHSSSSGALRVSGEPDPIQLFEQRLLEAGAVEAHTLDQVHEEAHAEVEAALEEVLQEPMPTADDVEGTPTHPAPSMPSTRWIIPACPSNGTPWGRASRGSAGASPSRNGTGRARRARLLPRRTQVPRQNPRPCRSRLGGFSWPHWCKRSAWRCITARRISASPTSSAKTSARRWAASSPPRRACKTAWNSPLDERGIIGTAMGIAYAGGRPVAEIQFCDYGFNTIDLLKVAGNQRWAGAGNFDMPIVVMTPQRLRHSRQPVSFPFLRELGQPAGRLEDRHAQQRPRRLRPDALRHRRSQSGPGAAAQGPAPRPRRPK